MNSVRAQRLASRTSAYVPITVRPQRRPAVMSRTGVGRIHGSSRIRDSVTKKKCYGIAAT
jgi:hypothetical protein